MQLAIDELKLLTGSVTRPGKELSDGHRLRRLAVG
jgi:hypothetical protein